MQPNATIAVQKGMESLELGMEDRELNQPVGFVPAHVSLVT